MTTTAAAAATKLMRAECDGRIAYAWCQFEFSDPQRNTFMQHSCMALDDCVDFRDGRKWNRAEIRHAQRRMASKWFAYHASPIDARMQNDRLRAKIFNQIDAFAPSLINFAPNIRINRDYMLSFRATMDPSMGRQSRWSPFISLSLHFIHPFTFNSIVLIVRASKSLTLESVFVYVCVFFLSLPLFWSADGVIWQWGDWRMQSRVLEKV